MKKSIWVGPVIQTLLETRKSRNLRRAIETCVSRYMEACKRHLPAFALAEWCAIFDALNGCWLKDSWSPTYIFAEVHDHEGLGEKWCIDQSALVRRLQELSYIETVAVADAAERFWATDGEATVGSIVGQEAVVE